MKQQIELTCSACGVKFPAEADYITPGVQGFVVNSKGERVEFIDPTAEHHCDDCLQEMVGPLWRSVDGKKGEKDGYFRSPSKTRLKY